jgi:hypothetical protein
MIKKVLIAFLLLTSTCLAKDFKYRFGSLSGLRDKQNKAIPASLVKEAFYDAVKSIENVCNVRIIPGGRFLVSVKSTSVNGRAVYTGSEIYINSAIRMSGQKKQLYVLWAHELGHWLGLGHTSPKLSMMNINLSYNAEWLPADITRLQKKYGKPKDGDNTDDNTDDSKELRKQMRDIADLFHDGPEDLLEDKYDTLKQQKDAIKRAINKSRQIIKLLEAIKD